MTTTRDQIHPSGQPEETSQPGRAQVYLLGALLFLFIPLVLFLFVRHPKPVGVSLIAGAVLMVGHRLLARPYMLRVLPVKCLWCNRVLETGEGRRKGETSALELRSRGQSFHARCCAEHRAPAARFFSFVEAWRWPLRMGIFVPLLFLLISLAATAAGQPAPLELSTAWFKLVVGVTVNVAALGGLLAREHAPLNVPFPMHNFFLLGARNLLWIFRLVGLWWIWQGLAYVVGP
jgi:hypothetical protein